MGQLRRHGVRNRLGESPEKNLPALLAGGGFKHGQHLVFDADHPPPLCNLFVSMLRRMGLDVDQFGSSTGTLPGLQQSG